MKKLFTFALAAISLLASCSKDNIDPGNENNGSIAGLKLSLSMPQATSPRADHVATAAESAIEDIYVFVFNQDGTTANDATNGHFGPFQLATHFDDKGGGTYDMKSTAVMTTTAGIKTVYVVMNLAENNFPTTFTTENQFITTLANVHQDASANGLVKYDASENVKTIVMMGKKSENLEAAIVGNGDNVVGVDIERAVARVITTTAAPSFDVTWETTDDMSFSIKKFFVTQDAHSSFLGPNFVGTRVKTLIWGKSEPAWPTVINLYDPEDYTEALPTPTRPKYITIGADPATPADRADLDRFYIGENATNNANSRAQKGNTTYAWIQTYASITQSAKMNAAGDDVEYTGGPIVGGPTGDDLWIVRVTGIQDYICNATNKQAVLDFLGTQYPGNVAAYEYPKGYVYYRVYLNATETADNGIHKYNVYRNQFIHIDVTGLNVDINKPGGFGGGYPGDKTDPEVPVDPTDPDGPNPIDPVDPIDEEEATLLVNITVKPWTYVKNSTILQ